MNCKNCEYAIKCRNFQDNEWYTRCTYEEGECVKITELEAQIEEMQEKLKADLIAKLKEQMQYSTSPSCTKGMELFIKSIEKWKIKKIK